MKSLPSSRSNHSLTHIEGSKFIILGGFDRKTCMGLDIISLSSWVDPDGKNDDEDGDKNAMMISKLVAKNSKHSSLFCSLTFTFPNCLLIMHSLDLF